MTVVAVDHLPASANHGGGERDGRALQRNLAGIGFRERDGESRAEAESGRGRAAGNQDDEVAADAGDLFLNALGGAGADGDRRDHGRNADHNSQHRERRAHLVHRQRA
jgi:hypothetical protein